MYVITSFATLNDIRSLAVGWEESLAEVTITLMNIDIDLRLHSPSWGVKRHQLLTPGRDLLLQLSHRLTEGLMVEWSLFI